MKRILKLSDSYLCKIYLNYQNINSILFTEPFYNNWFYLNYINCYSVNYDWFRFQYLPDTSMIYSNIFLDVKFIDSSIITFTKKNIINRICFFIDNGYYIQSIMDEYYVPNALFYKESHFAHEVLIYGYDAEEEIFFIQTINKINKPVKIQISFFEAVFALLILKGKIFKNEEWDRIKNAPSFMLLKPKKTWIDFDVRIILLSLDSFLKQEDLFIKKAIYSENISYLQKNRKIFYGIGIYDNLIEYIYSLQKNESIDMRFIYGFYEYIVIMKNRLIYIQKFISNKNDLKIFEQKIFINNELIKEHKILIHICIKNNIYSFQTEKIIKRIKMLKNKVFHFLYELYMFLITIDFCNIISNNRQFYNIRDND